MYDGRGSGYRETAMSRFPERWLPLAALLMFVAGCASTPEAAMGRFEARTVTVDGRTSTYQVFIPAPATRSTGPLPVVLFLHGSGERGVDGMKQTECGLGPDPRTHAAALPAR